MIAKSSASFIARSLLFVPGDRPERFAKAAASGAHAVIIDLEDAVATDAKHAAREVCHAFFTGGGAALLRINALGSAWVADDLALCALPGVLGIVLPKLEEAAYIDEVVRLSGAEKPIFPLIETAVGMVNVRAIASHASVVRLLFGTVDFCLDMGIDGDGHLLDHYRAMLALASRAAGLQPPVDGVTLSLKDMDALHASTLLAKCSGFGGKLCIHPQQVPVVNASFQPTAAQRAWATQVLALAVNNAGAFKYEGRMIDAPVLALARQMLSFKG